jgi:hypothetical protein
MADEPTKTDRFRADMPQIPGVGAGDTPAAPEEAAVARNLGSRLAVPMIVVAFLGAIAGWFFLHAPKPSPAPTAASGLATQTATPAIPAAAEVPAPPRSDGSVVVASLAELEKPWAFKLFTFHKRFGSELVEAIAVRLPGPANRAASYWAFSRQEPFGKCQLEFVSDLAGLSSQYGYTAKHPMVASACDGTLYDPLTLGTIPGGAWVRGEVVHGNGMRPPIAIEVRIQGDQLIATQIE